MKIGILKRLSNWYFSKNVLPYWAVLLADTIIVFVSAVFVYWVTNRTLLTFEQRFAVLYTSLLFSLLSWAGARCFKTYSGVLRYSSSVDLIKLAYANLASLVLALACTFISKKTGVDALSAFTYWEIIVVFLIATLLP